MEAKTSVSFRPHKVKKCSCNRLGLFSMKRKGTFQLSLILPLLHSWYKYIEVFHARRKEKSKKGLFLKISLRSYWIGCLDKP